ncbi:MAG: CD225/dispanin family protein, partial [Nocardiopsis sp. BM-2018]
ILGCLSVLGIIGLIFSLQVNSKWQLGDYAGAESAASTARVLGIISMVGFVLVALYVLVIIFGLLFAAFV